LQGSRGEGTTIKPEKSRPAPETGSLRDERKKEVRPSGTGRRVSRALARTMKKDNSHNTIHEERQKTNEGGACSKKKKKKKAKSD